MIFHTYSNIPNVCSLKAVVSYMFVHTPTQRQALVSDINDPVPRAWWVVKGVKVSGWPGGYVSDVAAPCMVGAKRMWIMEHVDQLSSTIHIHPPAGSSYVLCRDDGWGAATATQLYI